MEDKLKSLTETLYKDGLKKGQSEAEEMVSKAKKQAEKIIEEANAKAKIIIASAEKECNDKRRKVDSELVMSSKQVISQIKNEISALVSIENIKDTTDKAFDDVPFIQNLVLKIIETWDKNSPAAMDMRMELPNGMHEELRGFIEYHCKDQLNKGLEINFTDEVEAGFKILPKDSSYAIEFTDESFISFFNTYLKPMTREILFEKPGASE